MVQTSPYYLLSVKDEKRGDGLEGDEDVWRGRMVVEVEEKEVKGSRVEESKELNCGKKWIIVRGEGSADRGSDVGDGYWG
ncbi:hypothetical protein Pmani_002647 [Petrolisthes manimaculis]|uniref:Uncharacterized protein n=1 Tax=Petrolisthes manimaculis TaxID=1843537 RepID=A0AAE1QKI5_9EUCA|nr:hypothetical protein Pmani_002647 [Petrolisthes manimaculis]